jgi:hypothetical protein
VYLILAIWQKLKNAINFYWAEYKAFRVAFVVTFLFSIIAVSIYASYLAISVLGMQFFVWLGLVLVAILVSGKWTQLPDGFRGKYWWLPSVLSAAAMAIYSYYCFTLNRVGCSVFSAILSLISVGCLIYYSKRKE